MTSADDILITGVGVVSPIGIGRTDFWKTLIAGQSGVRNLDALADTVYPVKFGAEVVGFEPKKYVKPRKSLKVMCREVQMGFSAAALAVQDAELDTAALNPDRLGVVYGSEMLYCELESLSDLFGECQVDGDYQFELFGELAQARMYPLWMLKYLPNMTACHVGIAYDGRGPNNTIVNGDASNLLGSSA